MNVYVCGDSFCVSDPEYGPNWVDLIAEHHAVTNLSQVAASNLLISLQVEQALLARPDFILVQGTSCTRGETRYNGKLQPWSYHTVSKETSPFDDNQLRILKEYFAEMYDLDLAIYMNKCIIENTLQKLHDSGIPFRFDQGGFEHPNFAGEKRKYFERFKEYLSKVNIWDHVVCKNYRPYYHITDPKVHRDFADYYLKCMKND